MSSDEGFQEIRHNGEPVLPDVDNTTGTAYYQHIYRSTFGGTFQDKVRGQHMCLQWGNWCWKQAREYPLDAIKFLLGRFQK